MNQGLPGGSVVKNLPANAEMWHRTLGQEDPLRRKWQPPSSILDGKMRWTEEPGMLQSMGDHKDSETPEKLSMYSEVNTDIKLYRLSEIFYLLFTN